MEKKFLNKYDKNNYFKIIKNTKGNSLYTKRFIAKDTIIFKIGLDSIITSDSGLNTDCYKEFKILNYKINNNNLLKLALLEEFTNKKFTEYIDMLPKSDDLKNIPLFWSNENQLNIKNTVLEKEIILDKRNINNEYNKFSKSISFKKACLNLEKWYYISTIVTSRCCGIFKNKSALVPLFDMINHSDNYNVIWDICYIKNIFYITTIKDIAINEEITDTYGDRSNKNYLLWYGFCLENNNYKTEVKLQFNYNKIDDLWDLKKNLISKNVVFSLNNSVNLEILLNYFRIITTNVKENILIYKYKLISVFNERITLEFIKNLLINKIKKYKFNYKDTKIKTKNKILKNILIIVQSEQKILIKYLKSIDNKLKNLKYICTKPHKRGFPPCIYCKWYLRSYSKKNRINRISSIL